MKKIIVSLVLIISLITCSSMNENSNGSNTSTGINDRLLLILALSQSNPAFMFMALLGGDFLNGLNQNDKSKKTSTTSSNNLIKLSSSFKGLRNVMAFQTSNSTSKWTRLEGAQSIELPAGELLYFGVVPPTGDTSNAIDVGTYTGTGKGGSINFKSSDFVVDPQYAAYGVTAVALIAKKVTKLEDFTSLKQVAKTLAKTTNLSSLETEINKLAAGFIKTTAIEVKVKVKEAEDEASQEEETSGPTVKNDLNWNLLPRTWKVAIGRNVDSINANDSTLTQEQLDAISGLTSFTCNSCNIPNLNPLRYMPNLTTLSLKSNKINVVEAIHFRRLKSLRVIDLSNNSINAIPDTTFIYMYSLYRLSLYGQRGHSWTSANQKANIQRQVQSNPVGNSRSYIYFDRGTAVQGTR